MKRPSLLLFGIFLLSCSPQEHHHVKNPTDTHQSVTLLSVTDGDTIRVLQKDLEESVRIIGIDAAEMDFETKKHECFAEEASEELERLLSGIIVLVRPAEYDDRDAYGRLLRYVEVDGEDIGSNLIEDGYVKHFGAFAHPKYKMYRELEKEAEANSLGLHSLCKD